MTESTIVKQEEKERNIMRGFLAGIDNDIVVLEQTGVVEEKTKERISKLQKACETIKDINRSQKRKTELKECDEQNDILDNIITTAKHMKEKEFYSPELMREISRGIANYIKLSTAILNRLRKVA